MEEILASIRRIIADDDAASKPQAKTPESPPKPAAAKPVPPPPAPPVKPVAQAPAAIVGEDDIEAMLATLDQPAPAAEAEEVLELTSAMEAPTPKPFRTIDATQDVVFEEAPPPKPPEPRVTPPAPPAPLEQPLLSDATSAAVNSAFNTLAQTVLVQNAKTLEDLVKEMLRPMLKVWLDDNLPGLVERIVRSEIERVSRGGKP
jgi:cell pole-organizing protein PopZ